MNEELGIEVLIGKTLAKIEAIGNDRLTFICTDGTAYAAYHMQDCCESVGIHDIAGDLQSLIGLPITSATCDVSKEWPADVVQEGSESFTWTTHTLGTEAALVRVRWLGESNGWYGEDVHFGMTHA